MRVVMTAPSLDPKRNVSGIATVVREIIAGVGIVVIADILITRRDLQMIAVCPHRLQFGLLDAVEALRADHGKDMAADQAIVDEGRRIAARAEAGGIGQVVAARQGDAQIGAVGPSHGRGAVANIRIDA